MRVTFRKMEKVLERECRKAAGVEQPDFAWVQRYARERGVDSVTAAYSIGRCHGASQVASGVLAWLEGFGRTQLVNDALNLVRRLTPAEFDDLMRRHYNGSH